jgi:putative endonuclease
MRMRAGASRHYAYLLRCADGSYYAGYTVDPTRRLRAHARGRASRYTRGRGPYVFAALWLCPDRRSAFRLEGLLKRLARPAKHRLAQGRALGREVADARKLGARRRRPPRIHGGAPRSFMTRYDAVQRRA